MLYKGIPLCLYFTLYFCYIAHCNFSVYIHVLPFSSYIITHKPFMPYSCMLVLFRQSMIVMLLCMMIHTILLLEWFCVSLGSFSLLSFVHLCDPIIYIHYPCYKTQMSWCKITLHYSNDGT